MATRKAIALVSGLFQEVNTPTDKLDFAGNTTTDLSEGTNQYFTQSRARQSISVTDSGGDGSLSYNSTSGVITYTGPSASEVRAHLSATNSGTGFGSLAYDNTTGVFTYTVVTAANIRQQISVTDSGGDGSLSYNNSTGIITYTGPSASEVRSHFSVAGGSGLTFNSTTGEFGTSAIPNLQLANSLITLGTSSVSLGSTIFDINGLTTVVSDVLEAGSFVRVGADGVAGGVRLEKLFPSTLSAVTFEGSTADAFETSLTVVNPTADQTITLPNASGTVALLTSLSVAAGSGLTYDSTTGQFGTSAIPNAQLANSAITIGSTSVALGSTAATLGGITSVESTSFLVGDGSAATPGLRFFSDQNTGIHRIGADAFGVATNGTNALTVDPNQRILSGLTVARATFTGGGISPQLQVEGGGIDGGVISAVYYDNDTAGAWLILGHNRGTTANSNTIVADNDDLGLVIFQGADGTNLEPAAAITGRVNGTPGATDMPGSLVFATRPAGAAAIPIDRVTISSAGNLTLHGRRELRLNNAGNTNHTALIAEAGSVTNRTITFPDATGTVLLDTSSLPATFSDSAFRVQDNSDATKQLAFECSGISTATTRTMTVPNENGTISTQDFATAIAIALG